MVFVRLFGNTALSAALAVGALAAIYKLGGAWPTLAAFVFLHQGGALPPAYFPPIFSLLYRLYCTETVGYRLRHVLHPRLPHAHTCAWPGARRLGRPDISASDDGCVPEMLLADADKGGVVIVPVPILADNYAYIIACVATGECAVVDAADPNVVLRYLDDLTTAAGGGAGKAGKALRITHVLTTHAHHDHSGGNLELRDAFRAGGSDSVVFVGPERDKPHCTTRFVRGGDTIDIGRSIRVRVLESPGHTAGSVMFLVSDRAADASPAKQSALITGDVIFCGGCGAMFETKSARDVLACYDVFFDPANFGGADNNIDDANVLVYVGHEYSERLFGELVGRIRSSPRVKSGTVLRQDEQNCVRRYHQIAALAKQGRCTVPSTLLVEKGTNPLLTLERRVLEELLAAESKRFVSTAEIEDAVYCSDRRRKDVPVVA